MVSTAELLADLARAFPRERIQPDTVRVYLEHLADIAPAQLAVAVADVIRTSDYFPTIKALRERCAEETLALPGESEALGQVETRLRWARSHEAGRGPQPFVHPLVLEALKQIGGFSALRETDAPSVLRGQLLRLYRERRTAALREAMIGDTRLALGGAATPRELSA